MGEIVRALRGGQASSRAPRSTEIDERRAALVLPVLAQILGVPHE
jgi:hypothetical protein